MTRPVAVLGLLLMALVPRPAVAQWPTPKSPVIAKADGYAIIPDAVVRPEKTHVYRAIFDATHGAEKPTDLIPALNMAGSELNALAAEGVPAASARFAVIFHNAAIDGILDDAHYKAKFGVGNPNLPVLAEMKKAGVEIFVCGQNLVFENVDRRTLTSDVQVASDALIVLMEYQSRGYALMSF